MFGRGTATVVTLVLIALAIAVGATAAPGGGASPPPTLTPGVLVVATELGYPPFRIAKSGKYSGLELDLVEKIASNLGFTRVKFVNTQFDLLITGVAGKKYDMVADQMFGWAKRGSAVYQKVQDRIKLVSFSRPYYFPTYVLLTSKKHNPTLKTPAQFQDGMTVAVQKGGADFFWAEQTLVPKGVKIAEKRSLATTLPALETGQIDAIVEELTIVLQAEKTHPNLQHGPAIPPLSDAGVAFAYSPKNVDLRKAVDRELGKLIANGELKGLYTQYIPGFPFPKFPATSFIAK